MPLYEDVPDERLDDWELLHTPRCNECGGYMYQSATMLHCTVCGAQEEQG